MIGRLRREEVILFEGAKVGDFVPTIAWRLARARLKESLERPASKPWLDFPLDPWRVQAARTHVVDA